MKPLLHIIRNGISEKAERIIKTQAMDNAYGVSIVYLKDSKYPPIRGARIYLLIKGTHKPSIQAGEGSSIEYITYDELIDLITSAESITVW